MHDEAFYAERALRNGARGYLMKAASLEKLVEVMRLILSGGSFVSPQISARLVDAAIGRRPRGSNSPIESLSDREFEVFQHIGNGKSTK
jgi:DNA-binding NarL/FixJ family response regulator